MVADYTPSTSPYGRYVDLDEVQAHLLTLNTKVRAWKKGGAVFRRVPQPRWQT
jgi:hypothetical protein